MTKEELEQKIKNKETVYVIHKNKVYSLILDSDFEIIEEYLWDNVFKKKLKLNKIFETQAQAQHYLDNGNVTRIEKFPFVTWEEFKKMMWITFISSDNVEYDIMNRINRDDEPYLIVIDTIEMVDNAKTLTFEYSEKGFYEAYNEARKLFLGE